jgi:pimeloyl-ACP methyl ester carboxylesterase
MNFVLVHGAYHGAWCWDLVTPELEGRGHSALAVDLPASDPAAGLEEYARVIEESVSGVEDPVLVGHSMGGVPLPLVASRVPVRELIFVCALVPQPGLSMNVLRASEPVDGTYELESPEFTDLGDGVWMVGEGTARELFFNGVPAEVADWAVANLRPQCYKVFRDPLPLDVWPAVDSAYILCKGDRAVNPEWGRLVARERLGVEPIELEGGHSPELEQPAKLADALVTAAAG